MSSAKTCVMLVKVKDSWRLLQLRWASENWNSKDQQNSRHSPHCWRWWWLWCQMKHWHLDTWNIACCEDLTFQNDNSCITQNSDCCQNYQYGEYICTNRISNLVFWLEQKVQSVKRCMKVSLSIKTQLRNTVT